MGKLNDILLDTGKIHRRENVRYTMCGTPIGWLSYYERQLVSRRFTKKLPKSMKCQKCFGIKIPMKERSLDYILGLSKK